MITLIVGKNSYRSQELVQKIINSSSEMPEYIDVSALEIGTLADAVKGTSLFSNARLIIMNGLSERKEMWEKLSEWVDDISADTTLVLIEPAVDRRTKSYKAIAAAATVVTAEPLTDRDRISAEQWLQTTARSYGLSLSGSQTKDMVSRALGVGERPGQHTIDQQQLVTALAKLKDSPEVTDELIAAVMPRSVGDSVFSLLELSINDNQSARKALLEDLRLNDDPYRVFSLLLSQWAQLVTVALAGSKRDDLAQEANIHPFVIKKMQALSRHITRQQLHTITALCAELDSQMKLSQVTPWDAVERLLLAVELRGN